MPPKGRGRGQKGQKRASPSQPGPSVDAGAAVTAEPPRAPEPTAEQLEITEVHERDNEMIDAHQADITRTCLYSFDPLKSHFYIEKLGFTGVYIIVLILLKNIDCGYSLAEAVLMSAHNLCFEKKYEKYQNFYPKIFWL